MKLPNRLPNANMFNSAMQFVRAKGFGFAGVRIVDGILDSVQL
jgi:hypothetical protein